MTPDIDERIEQARPARFTPDDVDTGNGMVVIVFIAIAIAALLSALATHIVARVAVETTITAEAAIAMIEQ